MSLKDLEACRHYYEIVQAGDTPAPTCRACESLILYHLDERDNIYFKCLSCDRITYPGSPFFDAMEAYYKEWKENDSH